MGDLKCIQEGLEQNADLRWGFVTYRCTYDDDEKWARFMEFLNTRVRLNLQDEGGESLFERIDWAVQEDRESLNGAGPVAVREYVAVRSSSKTLSKQPLTVTGDSFNGHRILERETTGWALRAFVHVSWSHKRNLTLY
jgi:hypothetical protein